VWTPKSGFPSSKPSNSSKPLASSPLIPMDAILYHNWTPLTSMVVNGTEPAGAQREAQTHPRKSVAQRRLRRRLKSVANTGIRCSPSRWMWMSQLRAGLAHWAWARRSPPALANFDLASGCEHDPDDGLCAALDDG